jgi:hypothetical protein
MTRTPNKLTYTQACRLIEAAPHPLLKMLKDAEELSERDGGRLTFSIRAIRFATASVLHSAGLVPGDQKDWTCLGLLIDEAKKTCMCGEPVEGHPTHSGHSPVSMFDHVISTLPDYELSRLRDEGAPV